MLAQSVAGMTTLTPRVLVGHGRSITSESGVKPLFIQYIGHLNEYFDYWKLRLNVKKTVATCFHLDNKQAAGKLKLTLAGEVLVHDFAPKYLGVTLDRSLTYRKHTENVRDKVKSRCNIISKLAGTDWGAPAPVLRTCDIALVYSVAESAAHGSCSHQGDPT